MISEGQGNLLEVDVDAVVNTVNTVGVAGKGIALQFRHAYPANFKAYAAACKRGDVKPGAMFVFDTGHLGPRRYIINFPTKRHWRGRSRLADIESGLADLARVVRDYDIRSIALPPLGCGNGGLEWAQVEPLIRAWAENVPDVHVVVFPPTGAPANDEMPVATERPHLTPQRAAIIALFKRYLLPEYRLTSLEAQKLAYFLQVVGQPMKLGFSKEMFGPYSETLNHALQTLEGHYLRGYGDRSRPMALRVLPGADEEAETYLAKHPATLQRVVRTADLVRGFENAYGLELLATVHWATQDLGTTAHDRVLRYVQEWTPRKGQLFTAEHVARALAKLAAFGLVRQDQSITDGAR